MTDNANEYAGNCRCDGDPQKAQRLGTCLRLDCPGRIGSGAALRSQAAGEWQEEDAFAFLHSSDSDDVRGGMSCEEADRIAEQTVGKDCRPHFVHVVQAVLIGFNLGRRIAPPAQGEKS